jgi:hypothetical protein|tara:strand:- start:8883 stop:9275 length:393 start_codon:yes stop_codon:yes gene_type:complete
MGKPVSDMPRGSSKSGAGGASGKAKEGRVGKAGAKPPAGGGKKTTKPNAKSSSKQKHKDGASGASAQTKPDRPTDGIYHMKKALKKKLALVERYKELVDKNQLEDFMTKRRKKMMLRDHTLFPRTRNGDA